MEQRDVVIVGAGVAGGSLATALAREGLSVRILERTEVHTDRVRGEWLAPWGVAEARRLDLYDEICSSGGHIVRRHVGYGEGLDPLEADASGIDLSVPVPDVPGPLTYGHPALCNLFDATAIRAGAELLRGVERVQVTPGASPSVRYQHDGLACEVACRLVVGADGRTSAVRRQAGIELQSDEAHHLMSGLLVEDAHGWPDDVQTTGTERDLHFLVFPQGGGRVRLYLCFGLDQRGRLAGPQGPERFLESFLFDSVPHSKALASAAPAGPCPTYANQDTWTERPSLPGVVLVGDAAGYNDPIIGQGLSITLRDVRSVRDLVCQSTDWSDALFDPYAEERRERMRRLRLAARVTSRLFAEFDPGALERRVRAAEQIQNDPLLGLALFAAFAGPDALPAEVFEPDRYEAMLGSVSA